MLLRHMQTTKYKIIDFIIKNNAQKKVVINSNTLHLGLTASYSNAHEQKGVIFVIIN